MPSYRISTMPPFAIDVLSGPMAERPDALSAGDLIWSVDETDDVEGGGNDNHMPSSELTTSVATNGKSPLVRHQNKAARQATWVAGAVSQTRTAVKDGRLCSNRAIDVCQRIFAAVNGAPKAANDLLTVDERVDRAATANLSERTARTRRSPG